MNNTSYNQAFKFNLDIYILHFGREGGSHFKFPCLVQSV